MTSGADEMVEVAARFGAEVVAPVAAELDARPNPEDCFSWDIVEAASAAGLRTATLSPEHGGAGIDSLTTARVVEELGRADLGVSVVIAQTLKIAQTLQQAASPEQRDRFVPKFAADPRFLLAIGITEPENASNYFIPYPEDFRTTATKVRRLGPQREEAFHLQRQRGQPLSPLRPDRSRTRPGGGKHLLPGRATHRGVLDRQGPRQDGRTACQQCRASLRRLLRP